MKFPAPQLSCRPLPDFDADDWNAVDDAFASCDWCDLQQAWRDAPEPDFQPAHVRIGWRPDALWVDAHLTDLDIFNAASHLNDATYALGGIFEIFLRNVGHRRGISRRAARKSCWRRTSKAKARHCKKSCRKTAKRCSFSPTFRRKMTCKSWSRRRCENSGASTSCIATRACGAKAK